MSTLAPFVNCVCGWVTFRARRSLSPPKPIACSRQDDRRTRRKSDAALITTRRFGLQRLQRVVHRRRCLAAAAPTRARAWAGGRGRGRAAQEGRRRRSPRRSGKKLAKKRGGCPCRIPKGDKDIMISASYVTVTRSPTIGIGVTPTNVGHPVGFFRSARVRTRIRSLRPSLHRRRRHRRGTVALPTPSALESVAPPG